MAYNYGPPPGAFGTPAGAPPMGAPPGFVAAGMPAQSLGGMPAHFPPPPNLPPGINFNAPVLRFGGEAPRQGGPPDRAGGGGRGDRDGRGGNAEPGGRGYRAGIGADRGDRNIERDRQAVRENMLALQPPTREEVARTIFVGGLGKGVPNDDMLEHILRCAGKLRRWTRARDADDEKCKFGFAEYEDVESLEAAAEIYRDVKIPLFNPDGTVQKIKGEDDAEGETNTSKLLVVVDDASMEYIHEWKGKRKEDNDTRQFRIDGCKEDLRQTITGLVNQAAYKVNGMNGQHNGDRDGDVAMGDTNGHSKGDGAELITIPLTLEDELADIPAEMRATVAEEIKAFRDRSTRRDIERLRREEELEQEERKRSGAPARVNRLASPPPSGPAGGANGIPVGPRGQMGVHGAPSGPKGFRGTQLPSDYVNGVLFVPGVGPNGRGVTVSLNREDDDAEESDEELERRRQEKKTIEVEKLYQNQIRRWQNRERTRGAAQERERKREEEERRNMEKAKEDMLIKLANWNDDEEDENRTSLYYQDRSAWLRSRAYDREKEEREDEIDRRAEEREDADTRRREEQARGQADDFLGQMGIEAEAKAAEQAPANAFGGFKINLGSAAAKTKQAPAAASKRPMADVEGLLEDEEDAAASGLKRPELKPLEDTSTVPNSGLGLTDEEKALARQQLAVETPNDTHVLFNYPIKWGSISDSILDGEIRPFVEKKVVEYLGVQEDMLVDEVMQGIRERKKPTDIQEDLEGPLEDEAEVLVKKVWRLLVFWGECESRGLGS